VNAPNNDCSAVLLAMVDCFFDDFKELFDGALIPSWRDPSQRNPVFKEWTDKLHSIICVWMYGAK
jgi:hypothetical protein